MEREKFHKTLHHLSPKETIRAQCLACVGGHKKEVASCNGDGSIPGFHSCSFHPFRLGKGRPSIKILRQFCVQCMGGSLVFVRECETQDCPSHPYRMGKNPAKRGNGQNADRMAVVRAKKRTLSLRNSVHFERSTTNQGKGTCR